MGAGCNRVTVFTVYKGLSPAFYSLVFHHLPLAIKPVNLYVLSPTAQLRQHPGLIKHQKTYLILSSLFDVEHC